MDDRQLHRVATGTGLGMSVIALFLPIWIPNMSHGFAMAGVVLGVIIFIWGLWPLVRNLLPGNASSMPSVEVGTETKVAMAMNDELSLPEAARMALDAIDGSVFSMAARLPFNAPNGALCFVADRLCMNGMPIYGRQVPSSKSLLVPDSAMFGAGFTNDASAIEDNYSHQSTYTHLMVRRQELTAAIAMLKAKHPPSPDRQ